MTVQSAKDYITRMREDEAFHRRVNDCEDDDTNWGFIRQEGYDFTVQEFKQAAEEIYAEKGIDPIR
ncbi:MAG TPA: Nif11-like leader peptide family natural product precursor [Candidatus Sulfotelmatobacter sp.]|jgi:predicted ribosomally synthesized peptide with nif11-like leader|nr:Nif11-like leader peptide family natural product precursor [Candidatus Sulfotelmatobacter sp.]